MAEDQEDTKEQANETAQKKSSNLVLIIIVVILLFVLIAGGVVVALLMGGDDAPQQGNVSQMTNTRSNTQQSSGSQLNNNPGKREESLTPGPMFPLDGFTINLLSDSGRRYLKTTINLELSDESVATELESKSPIIRDVLIRVLTSKTLEEIATAKGKEKLKDQIVNQLNLRLRDGQIKNIYFVEFVIQ